MGPLVTGRSLPHPTSPLSPLTPHGTPRHRPLSPSPHKPSLPPHTPWDPSSQAALSLTPQVLSPPSHPMGPLVTGGSLPHPTSPLSPLTPHGTPRHRPLSPSPHKSSLPPHTPWDPSSQAALSLTLQVLSLPSHPMGPLVTGRSLPHPTSPLSPLTPHGTPRHRPLSPSPYKSSLSPHTPWDP